METPPSRCDPLEIASGVLIGTPPAAPRLLGSKHVSPTAALEAATVAALRAPPCGVAFSGGRDSSAVLAATVRAGVREGLPPPIPITLRFPALGDTEEDAWQESVIRHLGLDDWVRLTPDADDFDFVGPLAARVLRRHGVVWPPNAHFAVPIMESLGGGTLLTGLRGDHLFAEWRWQHAVNMLLVRAPPRSADPWLVAELFAPRGLRTKLIARRDELPLGWLRPHAAEEVARRWAAAEARHPVHWGRSMLWRAYRRAPLAAASTLSDIGAERGIAVSDPLADDGFLQAAAKAGGARGWRGRRAATQALFGELLPPRTAGRTTKASFDSLFWGGHSERFRRDWLGEGVDTALVDPDRLREEWSKDVPASGTMMLMQSAWLATHGDLA